jgi:hypothetical protein
MRDALTADVVDVPSLSQDMRRHMWSLYARFYSGTSVERFQADLAAKDYALLLRDPGGMLRGFSTIELGVAHWRGAPLRTLFSGDTVIEETCWGSQALAFAWLRFAGRIRASQPNIPLYWFLIVKGPRTYRYLPAFSREFIPDWRGAVRSDLHELLCHLATARFGPAFDAGTGVVRFAESRGHLVEGLASVSAREASRADVRFFLERNPGYPRGDELVCLCELAESNLRPIARRVFTAGTRS